MSAPSLDHLRGKESIHIEMVCLGNICRSPLAAAVLHDRAKSLAMPRIIVNSSGTANYHEGEPAHILSERVWQEAGYDYTHTARQFRKASFETQDLILCMDLTNRAIVRGSTTNESAKAKVMLLRQFDPALSHIDPTSPEAEKLVVPDPWGHEIDAFEDVLSMIERAVDGLIHYLK
jgi:protein-tyrosine phosphatase